MNAGYFETQNDSVRLAMAFAEKFPVAAKADRPTIISVTEFDQFCADLGMLDLTTDQVTITMKRQLLRARIDRCVKNVEWEERTGLPRFEITVVAKGQRYAVLSVADAYDVHIKHMPKEIKGFVKTKSKSLTKLRHSAANEQLPVEMQVGLDAQEKMLTDVVATIVFHLDRFNESLATLTRNIDRIIKKDQRKLANKAKKAEKPDKPNVH